MQRGLTYWIGSTLHVSVTNLCKSTSLVAARGPGFPLAKEIEPLPSGYEPTAQELSDLINHAYEHDPRKLNVGMGETDDGVVFAGQGDPIYRMDTVLETIENVALERHGVKFRVATTGLTEESRSDLATKLKDARMAVSVLLPAGNPVQYDKIMNPSEGGFRGLDGFRAFDTVCDFINECSDKEILVTCLTVDRPDVDVKQVRQLADVLGAVEVEVLSYHP